MAAAAIAAPRTPAIPLEAELLAALKVGEADMDMEVAVMEPVAIIPLPIFMEGEPVAIGMDMLGMAMLDLDLPLPAQSFMLPTIGPTCKERSEHKPQCLGVTGSTYLDNSGTGNNGVVGGLGVALGEDNVALASNALRDGDGEFTLAVGGKGSPDRAGDGDEGGVQVLGVHVHLEARASHQLDLRAFHSRLHGSHHQGGECLDGQHLVALGARDNEGRGNGVNLVEVQRVVEGLRGGSFTQGSAQIGAVTGLDGQDATGGGQVGVVHDVSGGTEVGADTDTFQDISKREEALDVGRREGVFAFLDRLGSGS